MLSRSINLVAEWLGTTVGTVVVFLLTAAWIIAIPIAGTLTATFALSVVAIVLPQAIIKRDHDRDIEQKRRDEIAEKRDQAMHAKLDLIMASLPEVPNDLIASEQEG